MYDGDGDAVLMLEELESCCKTSSKKGSSLTDEGRQTFVEILLTFLGNPRTLFLKVAEQAFSVFASDITSNGLDSLIEILNTEENVAGQQALFAQGNDEMEEEDEGSDDPEDASDVEMVDGSGDSEIDESESHKSGSDEENDSSDDSSSDAESDGQDESDDEELQQFNALLAETLKTSNVVPGEDDDSSDDEDMDDEQMMALDPHLIKIFKQRSQVASKKKEREGAKQTVVQFKSRVLDLLSIYIEKQHSSPLALKLVLPLLQRIRPSGNKQIADKSYKLLKNYVGARKAGLPKPEEIDTVWELLEAIHAEAKMGSGSGLHANACSSASVYVAKVLVSLSKENYSRIVDVYAESQKEWFMDRKSTVQPSLFTEFQNWSTQTRKQGK